MSSLLRTKLILPFKGRFFSGMENQVFLPIITRFCLPSTEEVVVILWKYLNSFLSGGQGRSPFLPMPMFWDTATMQFSERTMTAAGTPLSPLVKTERAVKIGAKLWPLRPLVPICAGEAPPPAPAHGRVTAGSRPQTPGNCGRGLALPAGPCSRAAILALPCLAGSLRWAASLPPAQSLRGKLF